MAFRSFDHPIAQRLCVLCVLAVSFLLGYLPSGSWVVGLVVATLWIFLPWLEILTKIRVLRMPLERELEYKSPPGRDLFPNLDDLTEEIEQEGFELINDLGCDWDAQRQFLSFSPARRPDPGRPLPDRSRQYRLLLYQLDDTTKGWPSLDDLELSLFIFVEIFAARLIFNVFDPPPRSWPCAPRIRFWSGIKFRWMPSRKLILHRSRLFCSRT